MARDENASLSVAPQKTGDLVSLWIIWEKEPVAVGKRRNSLKQQTGTACASDDGPIAVYAGHAGKRMVFAAGSGSAGGDYALSAGAKQLLPKEGRLRGGLEQ